MANKIKIATISSVRQFGIKKPRFNGYAVGHGPHKNKKLYDRKKRAHEIYKLMRDARKDKPI